MPESWFCMSGHEHRTALLAMVCDEDQRGPKTHLCPSCDVGLAMDCTCPSGPELVDGNPNG